MADYNQKQTASAAVQDAPKVSDNPKRSQINASLQRAGHAAHHRIADDGLLLVGMNPGSLEQKRTLAQGQHGRSTTAITNSAVPDTVTEGNTTYTLSKPADLHEFVATLHVEPDVACQLEELIGAAAFDSKDEYARLAEVYVKVSRGELSIHRLVLSGHSGGNGFIEGIHNGDLELATFAALGKLFPVAANDVKHLMIAACNNGFPKNFDEYRKLFPSLETIWGYQDAGPTNESGVGSHMKIWEKKTDGPNVADLVAGDAVHLTYGDHISTWSAKTGFHQSIAQAGVESVKALRDQVDAQHDLYLSYLNGEKEVTDPHKSPLRAYLNLVNSLVGMTEMKDNDRPPYEEIKKACLRLLFFSQIRVQFMKAYGSRMQKGYKTLGLEMPDFSTLSRAEVVAAEKVWHPAYWDLFESSGEEMAERTQTTKPGGPFPPEVKDTNVLIEGLMTLDPAVIPENWIEETRM